MHNLRRRQIIAFVIVFSILVFILHFIVAVAFAHSKNGLFTITDELFNSLTRLSDDEIEDLFYQYVESLDFNVSRQDTVRVGGNVDGSWLVHQTCLRASIPEPDPGREPINCIVYSFGIGDDWRFELEMATKYRCNVFAFDPSEQYTSVPKESRIQFFAVGLAGADAARVDNALGHHWPMRTLESCFDTLGHRNRLIRVLKLDIEYSEWDVLDGLVSAFQQSPTASPLAFIQQIALELHTTQLHARRPSRREYERYLRTLHSLRAVAGLRVWASEPNAVGGVWTSVCPRAAWLRPLRPFGCALEYRPCCHMRYYLNPRLGTCAATAT